ncbi:DNA-3-methyladenine glycosylase I [Devosia sp.]|uniref:DNA-3-methyladenine glycosylase I n=1 Tax=Devosia sp. TaxID=1871048 RepID=UPI003A93EC64
MNESETIIRCGWAGSDPVYQAYHDNEWGLPVTDDNRLYEKLCLEGFQSGLAWITILRKRENFRAAFHGFEIARVAEMTEADVERLLQDAGIVRHRGKIASTINNAQRTLELQREFGSLAAYVWRYAPAPGPAPQTLADIPAKTDASTALSKDLRKRGFSFVGPTTCYAFMQSMGLVNDHIAECFCRDAAETARKAMRG